VWFKGEKKKKKKVDRSREGSLPMTIKTSSKITGTLPSHFTVHARTSRVMFRITSHHTTSR
jgi:hypothetical protein